MKRTIFTAILLAGLGTTVSYGQAVVDPALRAAFQTSPTAQVVVTFTGDGAPQLPQLNILQQVGITKGITFRALPVAGVIATAAQVEALAKNPSVRSLYSNKQLDYYNYDDTN